MSLCPLHRRRCRGQRAPFGAPSGSSWAPRVSLVCDQFRASLPRYLLNCLLTNVLGSGYTEGSLAAWWTSMNVYHASHYVRFALSVVGHLLTCKGKADNGFFIFVYFFLGFVRFCVFVLRIEFFSVFVCLLVCFDVFIAVLFAWSFALCFHL